MNFQATAQSIRLALGQVQLVTTRHVGLPVLSSVLLEIRKTGGVVRGTNLSIGVESTFPVKVQLEGVAAIDGALLFDILGSVDGDEVVSFVQEGSLIHITTPHSESTIKTINHEDFPTLPKTDGGTSFDLSSDDFIDAIKSVVYAASSSDIKPEISSVYFYIKDNGLFLVSTDSFRLSEKKILSPQLPTDMPGIMIPVKNIILLMRIFAESKEALSIRVTDTQISWSTSTIYCVSRLVDGQYPDYRQIIPTEFSTEVIILKQDLIAALRILNIFSDKFNQVDMTVDVKEKSCTMTSQNADVGQNTTRLEAAITGEDVFMRFNARYVQDCLQSISGDSIALSFVAGNRPMVIRGINQNDFTYLVMPINK